MRVLHINSTSHVGGAARAMQRLHDSLLKKNHESQFLVGRSKFPDNLDVHIIWNETTSYRSFQNSILSRVGNQFEKYLGINSWANRPAKHLSETEIYQWADVIDLRNLFGGFFNLWSLPSLTAKKPVVWRLPDMWALTGHCAYPYDCDRWKSGCYQCPLLLGGGREIVEPKPTVMDGTNRVWKAKRNIYKQSQLHVIVNSDWMRKQVQESILKNVLTINVISNGVDLDIFKPKPKNEARKKLGLPSEGPILLWAAGSRGNYRKGYRLTVEALESIQISGGKTPMLITMGSAKGWNDEETLQKVKHFGYVRDPEKQALLFAAADGFICSTLADAQPQTALEALACGTPLIAFDIGPMSELAIPGKTGYLVPKTNSASLCEAITRFLNDEEVQVRLGEYCRQEALQKYDLNKQTDQYLVLYERILAERKFI